MTACNLLETAKAPGFAAFLLKEVRIEIEFFVKEKGSDVARTVDPGSGRSKSYKKSDSFVSLDLPPINNYRLTQIRNETSSIIAPGKVTICYKKEACHPGSGTPKIGKYSERSEDEDLSMILRKPIDYLEDLIDSSTVYMPRTKYLFTVDWENSQQYVKEIDRICKEVHSPFKSILNNLLNAGWLTKSEANDNGFNVRVELYDFRGDFWGKKLVSLPSVPSWCEQIKASE